ncbi:RecQ family ATP-dependent DNA helicase [Thalassobacillus pellis]|uniref:RecQ family ATP-dependent DNA helicase n=1 Tax=Thalassobacillus pellis TaxID=748008 RepID=UPI00195FF142|nr:ATP-dependent DNA helicase RecQ [Thalassobacillus pellis]MBM7552430.1 ATP-dependent DNA helicase RecQ [Thalassobacillus pellis]
MNTYDLEKYLKTHFGFDTFREGQKEIISDVLNGYDVLGVLPTGTGKSICYQLPAMLLDGITVVVSPLVSLMVDQVRQLKAAGFKRVAAINSFLDPRQKRQVLDRLSHYRLLYLSPEMLQNQHVADRLGIMDVALFVVDEAHCISQWGHEFRTDYLRLGDMIGKMGRPPVLALSGTATPEVQSDIIRQLDCEGMQLHIYPMDKANISFVVEHVNHSDQKVDKLTELLAHNHAPAMIYFSSRLQAENTAHELMRRLSDRQVAYYHGGMEHTDRLLIQQQFMNGQLDVICCTSAFGMGIDKKDIRLVIHYHIPPQLESFIQEVGRAGRDGNHSISIILYAPSDDMLPKKLIQSELPSTSDLDCIFSYLHTITHEDQPLPVDAVVMEETGLPEIQWRFIKHHLKRHQLLEDNILITNRDKWEVMKEEVERVVRDRYTYKMMKLSELIMSLQTQGCRRVMLYKPFQKDIKEPVVPCCDHCGFAWQKVRFDIAKRNPETLDWIARLNRLFLQGEANG